MAASSENKVQKELPVFPTEGYIQHTDLTFSAYWMQQWLRWLFLDLIHVRCLNYCMSARTDGVQTLLKMWWKWMFHTQYLQLLFAMQSSNVYNTFHCKCLHWWLVCYTKVRSSKENQLENNLYSRACSWPASLPVNRKSAITMQFVKRYLYFQLWKLILMWKKLPFLPVSHTHTKKNLSPNIKVGRKI